MIVYVIQKMGVIRIIQLSQCNGKSPLPRWKQGNYPTITIYGAQQAEIEE